MTPMSEPRTAAEYECRFCGERIHSNGTYWLAGPDGWECSKASGGHAPILGQAAHDPAVLPDSDAPTPREATPVDGLREALQDLPFSRQWPTQKPPGEWYVRVEDAISFMVEERAREAQAGSRSARSSTAPQAAASTAAAGEGATGDDWEAQIATLKLGVEWVWQFAPGLRPQASGDLHEMAESFAVRMRPKVEAALRATSETPRETPLAGPLDVAVLSAAIDNVTHDDYDLPRFRGTYVLAAALRDEYQRLLADAGEGAGGPQ